MIYVGVVYVLSPRSLLTSLFEYMNVIEQPR